MNNIDLQHQLLDLAAGDCLILAESQRFVHQLHWRYRHAQRELGRKGWEPLRALTLNRWLEDFWRSLWPEYWPAPLLTRWNVLRHCVEQVPPPEPLEGDITTIQDLDDSFELCLRYGLDPGSGEPANHLVEWRRKVWHRFQEELTVRKMFHPALLPQRLYELLSQDSALFSSQVAITGFEFAGHWEKALIRLLRERDSRTRYFPLPAPSGKVAETLVYSDPDQDVYGLVEDLVHASRRIPLHQMAVVILDGGVYWGLLGKCMEDLFGPPLVGEKGAYNLFPGRTLADQPLFESALLPLAFVIQKQPRVLLLSLLRSPYYEYPARWSRSTSQWDWTWRQNGLEQGLEDLIGALSEEERRALPEKGGEIIRSMSPLFHGASHPVREWLKKLKSLWSALEFPVLANEEDHIAWQRVSEILDRFETELGSVAMSAAELTGWLKSAAQGVFVQKSGYEDAGIQVISILESRGLAFERLYVPGLISDVLPQSARTLPFLSPGERKRVQGGTGESQFAFAGHLYGHLHAIAPELRLSRPLMDRKGEPLLASPFWPQEGEKRVPTVTPWRDALPALQRALWVSEGMHGLASCMSDSLEELVQGQETQGGTSSLVVSLVERGSDMGNSPESSPDPYSVGLESIPREISVSMLETLLACASRFFFQEMLGIEELPDIPKGLDPRIRGQKIHEALASCGRKITSGSRAWDMKMETLLQALRESVEEEYGSLKGRALWNVEVKRLIGEEEAEIPGLLVEWIRSEWARLMEGWRWEAFEHSFSGLRLGGASIALRGRLDRLDSHPHEGLMCWDYKTGRAPSVREVCEDFITPQLPVYLMAVQKGSMARIEAGGRPLAAGYVNLGSVRTLRHYPVIRHDDDVDGLLRRWEEHITATLARLEAGDMAPTPEKASCEPGCPFHCLCGVLLMNPGVPGS